MASRGIRSEKVAHDGGDSRIDGVAGTERWHATVRGREFELLLTGTKFFDSRAEKGGGGAVDLASHLFGTEFRGAVACLRQKGI